LVNKWPFVWWLFVRTPYGTGAAWGYAKWYCFLALRGDGRLYQLQPTTLMANPTAGYYFLNYFLANLAT